MCAMAAVGLLTVGVGQAFAQEGSLEICKRGLGGAAGLEFPFTVEDDSGNIVGEISLVAGTSTNANCTSPGALAGLPVGNYTITEGEATNANGDEIPTRVRSITSSPTGTLVSRSLSGRTITVRVREDAETLVTFTNDIPPAQIKICKETNTPSFEGALFTFRFLNQAGQQLGTKVAVAASFPEDPSQRCSGLRSFTSGTVITVDEEVPSNAIVTEIRVEGNCEGPLDDEDLFEDLDEGSVDVRVQSGVCIVTFVDESLGPEQTGFIEICKNALELEDEIRENNNGVFEEDVLGESFTFTIEPASTSGEDAFEVIGGQCTEPIEVPAGFVTVTEEPDPRFRVVDIFTRPEGMLVSANLDNGEAVVEVVPTENPEQETQVHFVNERERGQLKICKALGPFSSDLAGMSFEFVVIDPGDPDDPTDDQVVGHPRTIRAASTTQCIIIGDFPTGEEFIVDELDLDDPETELVDEGEFIVTTGCPRAVTIQPGVNTVTCVNSARGKLEICKEEILERPVETPDDPTTPEDEEVLGPPQPIDFDPVFTYTVQRLTNATGTGVPTGARTTVRVVEGSCSEPIFLAPGPYRVTENDPGGNYEVIDIEVIPEDAEISHSLALRRADVLVRFGEITDVIFENRIRRAFVKICKEISPGSTDFLRNEFRYTIVTGNGQVDTATANPSAGRPCSGLEGPYPVLIPFDDPNTMENEAGTNNTATVTEEIKLDANDQPVFFVSNIRLQNTRGVVGPSPCVTDPMTGQRMCDPSITFKLAPGVNIVHFENTAVADP